MPDAMTPEQIKNHLNELNKLGVGIDYQGAGNIGSVGNKLGLVDLTYVGTPGNRTNHYFSRQGVFNPIYRDTGKLGKFKYEVDDVGRGFKSDVGSIDYRKNPLSDKEKEMYQWFDEQMRFDKLPQTTNKQSIEVLENFKQRIKTPEGQRRMKELGIKEQQLLQDLKIVEDPNTYGYYRPSKNTIAINPEIPLPKKVVRHEIEHGVQNASKSNTTEIDDILSGLILRKEGTPNKVWDKINTNKPVNVSNYKSLISNKQDATDYFLTGSSGAEKSSFLGEVQQYMMDTGKIPKKSYVKITPEMVKETMVDAMFDEEGGGRYLRLFNIIKDDSKNYELISKALNKMLTITPAIGAGVYMQSKENKSDDLILNRKQGGMAKFDLKERINRVIQEGGNVSAAQQALGYKDNSPYKNMPYQDIYSDRITMQGVSQPLAAVTDNGISTVMQPGGEYYFPGANVVREVPVMRRGGLAKALGYMPTKFQNSGNTSTRSSKYDENDGWIREILALEFEKGGYDTSANKSYGLSNYGYKAETLARHGEKSPTNMYQAVAIFRKHYLPKLLKYPLEDRKRMGDLIFNAGEDARIFQIDKFLGGDKLNRKSLAVRDEIMRSWMDKNHPNVGIGSAQYNKLVSDERARRTKEIDRLYDQYKIAELPQEERVNLLDEGRKYYYQNIEKVKDSKTGIEGPNPAYEKAWKYRVDELFKPKDKRPDYIKNMYAKTPDLDIQPTQQRTAAQPAAPVNQGASANAPSSAPPPVNTNVQPSTSTAAANQSATTTTTQSPPPPTFKMSGVPAGENTKNVTLYQDDNGVKLARDKDGNVFIEHNGVIDKPIKGKNGKKYSEMTNQEILNQFKNKDGNIGEFYVDQYGNADLRRASYTPYGESVAENIDNEGYIYPEQKGGETRYQYRYNANEGTWGFLDTQNPDKGWTNASKQQAGAISSRYGKDINNVLKTAKNNIRDTENASWTNKYGIVNIKQDEGDPFRYRVDKNTNEWEIRDTRDPDTGFRVLEKEEKNKIDAIKNKYGSQLNNPQSTNTSTGTGTATDNTSNQTGDYIKIKPKDDKDPYEYRYNKTTGMWETKQKKNQTWIILDDSTEKYRQAKDEIINYFQDQIPARNINDVIQSKLPPAQGVQSTQGTQNIQGAQGNASSTNNTPIQGAQGSSSAASTQNQLSPLPIPQEQRLIEWRKKQGVTDPRLLGQINRATDPNWTLYGPVQDGQAQPQGQQQNTQTGQVNQPAQGAPSNVPSGITVSAQNPQGVQGVQGTQNAQSVSPPPANVGANQPVSVGTPPAQVNAPANTAPDQTAPSQTAPESSTGIPRPRILPPNGAALPKQNAPSDQATTPDQSQTPVQGTTATPAQGTTTQGTTSQTVQPIEGASAAQTGQAQQTGGQRVQTNPAKERIRSKIAANVPPDATIPEISWGTYPADEVTGRNSYSNSAIGNYGTGKISEPPKPPKEGDFNQKSVKKLKKLYKNWKEENPGMDEFRRILNGQEQRIIDELLWNYRGQKVNRAGLQFGVDNEGTSYVFDGTDYYVLRNTIPTISEFYTDEELLRRVEYVKNNYAPVKMDSYTGIVVDAGLKIKKPSTSQPQNNSTSRPPYLNGGQINKYSDGGDSGQDFLSGAATGAKLGTMLLPGIGTGIGAAAGALFGGLLSNNRQRSAEQDRVRTEMAQSGQNKSNLSTMLQLLSSNNSFTNLLRGPRPSNQQNTQPTPSYSSTPYTGGIMSPGMAQLLPPPFQDGAQVESPIYTSAEQPTAYSVPSLESNFGGGNQKPVSINMDKIEKPKGTSNNNNNINNSRIVTFLDPKTNQKRRAYIDANGNIIGYLEDEQTNKQGYDNTIQETKDYADTQAAAFNVAKTQGTQPAKSMQQGGPAITSLFQRNMARNNQIKNNISMNKMKLEDVINLSRGVNPFRMQPQGVYKSGGLIMEGGVSPSRAGFSRQPISGASSTGPLGPRRTETPDYNNNGVRSVLDLPSNEYIPIENMVPIQAEIGEMIVLPTGDLMPVMARKRHHQMKDDEVTDITPENSYILSAHGEVRINRDEADLLITETGVKPYRIGTKQNPPTEKTLASIMTKRVMRPAEVAKRINSLFPVVSTENPFELAANVENKINRKPYLEGLIQLSEIDKLRKGLSDPAETDVQQAAINQGSPMLARQGGRMMSRPGIVKAQDSLGTGNVVTLPQTGFLQSNQPSQITLPAIGYSPGYWDAREQNIQNVMQRGGSGISAEDASGALSFITGPANFAARLWAAQAARNAEKQGIARERGIYDEGFSRMSGLMGAGTAMEAAMLGAQNPFVRWQDTPSTYIDAMRTQTPQSQIEAAYNRGFANLPDYSSLGRMGLGAESAARAQALQAGSNYLGQAMEADRAAFNQQQQLRQGLLAQNVAGRLQAQRATDAALNKILSGYGNLANRYTQGQMNLRSKIMDADIGLSRAEQASKTGLYGNRVNAFTTFTSDLTAGADDLFKILGMG
jgi:hypothetical protein